MLSVAQIKYWGNPLESKQEYLDISEYQQNQANKHNFSLIVLSDISLSLQQLYREYNPYFSHQKFEILHHNPKSGW